MVTQFLSSSVKTSLFVCLCCMVNHRHAFATVVVLVVCACIKWQESSFIVLSEKGAIQTHWYRLARILALECKLQVLKVEKIT